MIRIREIHKQDKEAVEKIVTIHLDTFQGFFLTFMGRGFLRHMYRAYCDHTSSGILAAFDETDEPVGFLAYSSDISNLYHSMITKRFAWLAWYAAGAVFRNPSIVRRIVHAFFGMHEKPIESPHIVLASIGVRPDAKRQGIGSRLIDELKNKMDTARHAYIKLDTDAKDNDAANRFYQKNDFVLSRSFSTREGRLMNEYRFKK